MNNPKNDQKAAFGRQGADFPTDRSVGALEHALRRANAPEGFADRVLARIDAAERQTAPAPRREYWWSLFFARPAMRWVTAAALSVAIVGGGVYHHVQLVKAERERIRGEAAKQQLVLALRIAGSKLQLAKSKVSRIDNDRVNTQHLKE